jgi:hypothetical protein
VQSASAVVLFLAPRALFEIYAEEQFYQAKKKKKKLGEKTAKGPGISCFKYQREGASTLMELRTRRRLF